MKSRRRQGGGVREDRYELTKGGRKEAWNKVTGKKEARKKDEDFFNEGKCEGWMKKGGG